MASYRLLAARLFDQPLLVRPAFAQSVSRVFMDRLDAEPGGEPTGPPTQPRAVRDPVIIDGVLVLPVVGGLMHRGDAFDADCGMQSYTNLANTLHQALGMEEVRAILLDIDSPGGEAGGCFSFADTVRDASRHKPVWAVANAEACSAAYAIGCSASRFLMARDAVVGSIGVVTMHLDMSKAAEKAGVVVTYIFAGAHKADGNPFEALSPEVRSEIQARIDERYRQFVELVAERRGITEAAVRATEARVYLANQAPDLGLVDGVMSIEEARRELAQAATPTKTGVAYKHGKVVTWQ